VCIFKILKKIKTFVLIEFRYFYSVALNNDTASQR
jgi:hypothetical protein